MDWFERLTGFREDGYEATRARLAVDDGNLVSKVNGRRYGIGRFETPTLAALRAGASAAQGNHGGRTRVSCLTGDARALHRDPNFAGATFQVASQFNALEMVGPNVTPEHGVTRYMHDLTQGPACAIAAGAATIWRNYFVPVGGEFGQTASRQIDTLAGLGAALADHLGRPVRQLWAMRNGYALATPDGLRDIGRALQAAPESRRDPLRAALAVAWHRDVEVTDGLDADRPRVSQVFCSALPVAYSQLPPAHWEPLARLVLEAAYEATLRIAAASAAGGGKATVLLTRLGGGAFGNPDPWIDDAIWRALSLVEFEGLDVRLVSFGADHPAFVATARRWAAASSAQPSHRPATGDGRRH